MAATVKVRNLGPFDRDIRTGGESLAVVPVGESVEVSADLAASLAEQVDAWQIVTASAGKGEAK